MTSLRAALVIWNDALRALAAHVLFLTAVLLPLFLVARLIPALVQLIDTPLDGRTMFWVGAVLASALYTLMATLWLRRQAGLTALPDPSALWAVFWRGWVLAAAIIVFGVFALVQIYRVAGQPGTAIIPLLALLNSLLVLALAYVLLRISPALVAAACSTAKTPRAVWRAGRGHGATLVWVAVLGMLGAAGLTMIALKLGAIPVLVVALWFVRVMLALSVLGAASHYIEASRAPE